MPDKDGAEEKTTKSVVSKRQKQMMGEEGYDIARDMGRVRPSKDKKDATTMPPSKEMEKTRKVNKGPSALERVKKKYEGQIMDVKKEELDLTKVAEAFGGYIVESEIDPKTGKIIARKGEAKKTEKLIKKIRAGQEKGTERLAKAAGIPLTGPSDEKSAAAQAFRDMKLDKDKKFSDLTPDVKTGMRSVAAGKGKAEPKPKPRVFSYMRKISPEAQKKVDAVKKEIEMKNIIKPDRRLKSSRVSTSSPEFGKPKIPSTKKSSVKLTKPSDVELPKSFKDFSSKLKSLKSDIKQTKNKVKQLPKPKSKVTSNYTSSNYDIEQLKKRGQYDQYKKIKDTTPKGGIPNWMKQVDKKRKEIQQDPYQKGVKPAFKRVFLTPKKGVRGLVGKAVKNPVGTAIASGIARDAFRNPLPQLRIPTVQGGKVGRRTAG